MMLVIGIFFHILPYAALYIYSDKTKDEELPALLNAADWSTPDYSDLYRLQAPYFDNATTGDVQVQLGDIAYLQCHVYNLGKRTVSWVRKRDWHILSTGQFTYTNDDRFQVLHKKGSNEWSLQIKSVQERDRGTYQCQVTTKQGSLSKQIRLDILVPEAVILGSQEYHIEDGSTINLVCIIKNVTSPPLFMLWYRNDEMLNYRVEQGGVSVTTEKGERIHSRLIIRHATYEDSGNYTCSAQNTIPASINVFVSKGDTAAAVHRINSSSTSTSSISSSSSTPTTSSFPYILVMLLVISHSVLIHR